MLEGIKTFRDINGFVVQIVFESNTGLSEIWSVPCDVVLGFQIVAIHHKFFVAIVSEVQSEDAVEFVVENVKFSNSLDFLFGISSNLLDVDCLVKLFEVTIGGSVLMLRSYREAM